MSDEQRLDDDLSALVREASRLPPVDAERLSRARARLHASVLGLGGAGLPPARGTIALTKAKLAAVVALAFVGGVGAGVTGVTGVTGKSRAPSPPAAPVVSTVFVAAPLASVVMAPVPTGPSPIEVEASARRPRPVPSSSSSSPPRSSVTPRTGERELLDQARRALREGEGDRALDLVSRHESDYPNGALSEERDVVRIQALILAGRTSDARDRLAAFKQRYPASPFLLALVSQLPSHD